MIDQKIRHIEKALNDVGAVISVTSNKLFIVIDKRVYTIKDVDVDYETIKDVCRLPRQSDSETIFRME